MKKTDLFRTLSLFEIIGAAGLLLWWILMPVFIPVADAAAEINPEMLQTEGSLVSGNIIVLKGLIASGVILASGYILLGIASLKTKAYPKAPMWLLIIGTSLFATGI